MVFFFVLFAVGGEQKVLGQGMAWTSSNFINNYQISPCTNSAVKNVVVSSNLVVNLADAIPHYVVAINYFNGVAPSLLQTDITEASSDVKTLTFPTALNSNSALSTTIQKGIYRCDQFGTPAGYLLSALTQGGCLSSTNLSSNVFNAYSANWLDVTTNTAPALVPNSAFVWSSSIIIGRDANNNIAGIVLGIPGHNYVVTVTDANGATATASYTVPTQIPNQFTTTVSYTSNCMGQVNIASPLLGKGSYLFLSGQGAPSFNYTALANAPYSTTLPLSSGNYELHVVPSIESAYCSDIVYPPIHIGATISPTTIGECVTALNANAGGTGYAWSNGQTTQSIAPTSIGTYTVTVTNATACSTATYSLTGGNTVACCQAGLTYTINTPTYTATSGTWANGSNPFGNTTAALNLNTNFIVPNGVTLTINNLNLNFSSTSKITIQKGGRLNLNGCVLDGLCSGMWLGIQVEGNGLSVIPTAPLPPGYVNPGSLFSNNSTEIKNAVIGVTNTLLPNLTIANIATHLLNYNETLPSFVGYSLSSLFLNDYLWTTDAMLKAGGIVNTQNTTFTNCFQGINLSWRGHKLNKIDRCTFNSPQTGSLLYPFNAPNTRTEAGIALMGSTIDEIGTSWALTAISNSTFNYTKFGIRANFINYLTIENCSFDSNKVGTSVAHFLEDASSLIKIRQNTYTQCVMSIQASGTDNLSIRDNHINESYNVPSPDRKIGIYARGSNPIARNNSIGGTQFGMILTDTEADGSLLAGNVLNNCFTNITAEGNNTGITTRCNHLINRWGVGIQIRPWSINNEPGDLGIQGKCDENQPAAFTFTTATGVGNPFAIRLEANTNPFTLEDVGANLLSNSSNPDAGGSYSGVGCNLPDFSLDQYCSGQGYTSIE
jgi:hypothetical protein